MLRLALVLLLLAIGAISSPSANAGLGFCNGLQSVGWTTITGGCLVAGTNYSPNSAPRFLMGLYLTDITISMQTMIMAN